MSDVTEILARIQNGESEAASDLWPIVYDELRKLAAYRLKNDRQQSLNATDLVHEAYLRLVDPDSARHWNSRSHFFSAAGEAMRRILIDFVRKRGAEKRGGNATKVNMDVDLVADGSNTDTLLAINDAVSELERHDKVAASLVKLRFFGGMTHRDAAEALGISRREADRMWVIARTWIYKNVERDKTA